MKYDFKNVSTLIEVRAALRELLQNISMLHQSIVCETELKEITVPFRKFKDLAMKYTETPDYMLLKEYTYSISCLNFFRHFNEEFFDSLERDCYTIQEVLSIMKIIGVASDEIEQEIANINERYFS
ncbi:MAG: hypothetical protein IJX99_01295 [Clostridia bacterium]|nr:hypothetical protein [Clostridia bacterium]